MIEEELSVSKQSYKLIMNLSKIRSGSSNQIYIFTDPILSTLKEMLGIEKDALKLRVLELMVDISRHSDEHMNNVAKEGFLQSLFDDLKKDQDVLVQLNAIELVSNLAESKHGFDYLNSLTILTQMDSRLNEISSGSLSHFLMPGYIKFFGRLAHHKPSTFSTDYPIFKSILINMLNNDSDQEQQLLALEVLAHVSLKQEGKQMLLNNVNKSIQDLLYENLRSKLKSGTSEAKVRALDVFSDLIRMHDSDQDLIDDNLAKELFEKLYGLQTMEFFTDLARKPFADISKGAYNVLMATTVYSWGIEMLRNVAGFFEYLLDRSTAKEKEAKDRKYALIVSVCGQSQVHNIIPPEVLKQLITYTKQGAYYVESIVEVAIDEQ